MELVTIPIEDGELSMLPQLPMPIGNAEILARLLDETPWRADTVVVYGKRYLQPRLTAWYGEASYTYSGLTLQPLPLTPLLAQLRAAVERVTGQRYNSVLLNYYRDGADSMGMHSDDEPELGPRPVIASLSYGATRTFILRHRRNQRTVKLDLTDGSLVLMAGTLQAHWRHGINKTAKLVGPRLNLTFRYVS
ncbi:alpha-ketoglutarate-dependent dioxygenase AlkB [Massilia sp. Root335]|uniref:alpha-ketoglutarate-dependent dioxygenase AlkB family protein n=1 Tax=Massilia sp. Root335 TaxID=1736517 RepID=UPI000A7DF5C1|nr:alpha-ketoglutarate-dependent dioxygenase AlkB [Massilia sp. Root335]